MKPNFPSTPQEMEAGLNAYFDLFRREYPDCINNMLNLSIHSCDPASRTAVFLAHTEPWMSNSTGVVHGGILATYLDYAMGMLCHYLSGARSDPSIHLDTNFLRPVSLNEAILIRASVTKLGARVCFAESSIARAEEPETPLATALGTYCVIP